jgi:dinuclear metal center YbgI/SA1388 family protein
MASVSRARAIADVLAGIAERAPFSYAADWDPVGLTFGDPSAQVRRLAVCHEVTEAVVAALEAEPADLLVTYHPLLFRPTNQLVAGRTPEGRALRLLRAGVAVAAVHTNFDVAPGGTADALAEALGLAEVEGFAALFGAPARKLTTFVPPDAADSLLAALSAAGAAEIGNYSQCSFRTEGVGTYFAGAGTAPAVGQKDELTRAPEVRLECLVPPAREAAVIRALLRAHPYEEPAFDLVERRGEAHSAGRIGRLEAGVSLREFAARVEAELSSTALRVAGDPERELRRVAVLPGSGEDFLGAARAAGADLLVTGDLRHHAVQRALDSGLCAIDAGHIATERPGLERLLALVASFGVETRSLGEDRADPWSNPS